MYSNIDLSYLAGLIEGEGCLSISKDKRGYFKPIMEISMTDIDIVSFISKKYGIKMDRNRHSVLGNRELFRVAFRVNSIKELLPKLIPYMKSKIKIKQANLIIQLQKDIDRTKYGNGWSSGKKLNSYTLQYRENLLNNMKSTRYRGD